MLIVFSQALSMAPSYIQIRFSAIARQQWGFKAPILTTTIHSEK